MSRAAAGAAISRSPALAGWVAAHCQEHSCTWEERCARTPAALRDLVQLIVKHVTTVHAGACRQVAVVIHAAGDACDHEHGRA